MTTRWLPWALPAFSLMSIMTFHLTPLQYQIQLSLPFTLLSDSRFLPTCSTQVVRQRVSVRGVVCKVVLYCTLDL